MCFPNMGRRNWQRGASPGCPEIVTQSQRCCLLQQNQQELLICVTANQSCGTGDFPALAEGQEGELLKIKKIQQPSVSEVQLQ